MKNINYHDLSKKVINKLDNAISQGNFKQLPYINSEGIICVHTHKNVVYLIKKSNREVYQLPLFIKTESEALEFLTVLASVYKKGETNGKQELQHQLNNLLGN